jgi:ABC-type phosphate/phosphonate transport system substrate-binding protein
MQRRTILAAFASIVAVTSAQYGMPAFAYEAAPVKVSIVSAHSPAELRIVWQPVIDQLSDVLGMPVDLFIAADADVRDVRDAAGTQFDSVPLARVRAIARQAEVMRSATDAASVQAAEHALTYTAAAQDKASGATDLVMWRADLPADLKTRIQAFFAAGPRHGNGGVTGNGDAAARTRITPV